MPKRIYKYELNITGLQVITTHKGAKVLFINEQYNAPYIWLEVDTDQPYTEISISTFGTGHIIPDNIGDYLGSYFVNMDRFVGHVYLTE